MKRILLTGGGSGGHIFPLVAVAKELKRLAVDKKTDFQLKYFGPNDIYADYLAKEEIKVKPIVAAKLRRYFSWRNFIDGPLFLFSLGQALFKVYWFMPDIAFSKGGPGALPVLLACRFYRIPYIIHESDSVPGLTNSLSGKKALLVELAFESAKKYFAGKDARVVGNPIRFELLNYVSLDPNGAKERLGLETDRPLLLVLGGSSGSVRINKFIFDNLEMFLGKYQIIHQTGTGNYEEYVGREQKYYKPFAFLEKNYGEMLAASDLVISRAGAGAIFELAIFGKPAILIPLPEAANNHQKINAYEYAETGAAEVVEEPNLLDNVVLGVIEKILNDPKKQQKMSLAALNFARPEAAKAVALDILDNI